jgi:hypothetical protein
MYGKKEQDSEVFGAAWDDLSHPLVTIEWEVHP